MMLAARDVGSWTKAALCLSLRFQYFSVLFCLHPDGPGFTACSALAALSDAARLLGLLDMEGVRATSDWLEDVGVGSKPGRIQFHHTLASMNESVKSNQCFILFLFTAR